MKKSGGYLKGIGKMKRIISIIFISFFMATAGHCQEVKQPLQLTITSDKSVYEVGEEINIQSGFLNTSDNTIDPTKHIDSYDGGRSLFFKNEKGEECELKFIGGLDEMMSTRLLPKQTTSLWAYPVLPLKDGQFKWGQFKLQIKKGKGYSFTGKQEIYLKAYGLTSNTITIEVVDKGKAAGKKS